MGESLEPFINVRPEPRVRVGIEQIEGADRKDEQAGHSQEHHVEQADPLAVADQGQFQKRPADEGHQQNTGDDEHGGKGDREPPPGQCGGGDETAHEQSGTGRPGGVLRSPAAAALSGFVRACFPRRGGLAVRARSRLVISWPASASRTRTRPQHGCMKSL